MAGPKGPPLAFQASQRIVNRARPMLGAMLRLSAAFGHSLRALRWAWVHETAVREEMVAIAAGVGIAALISDSVPMFAALVGVLLLLVAVELLNTAIEKLCDHVTPQHHPQIGVVKDLGSAAVLATAVLAVGVWGWGVARWWMG